MTSSQPGRWQTIPEMVLSAADYVREINRAYALGARGYLVKPFDFRDFVEAMGVIRGSWLWMTEQPEISHAGGPAQSGG